MKATSLRALTAHLGTALLMVALFPASASAARASCQGDRATIVGTSGRDNLKGTAGPDVIAGKGGNDVIEGLGRGDKICGGRGDDQIFGNRGGDWLIGGSGDDRIRGDRGEDRLDGNAGDDYFNIGRDPDHDVIDGGEGLRDMVDASFPSRDGDPEGGSEPAHIDLATGTARTEMGGRDDLGLYSIERVYGSSHGDTIIGDDRANSLDAGYSGGGTLDGGGGDDVLRTGQDGSTDFLGGAGDDLVVAFEGTNSFDGGEGSDTFAPCDLDGGGGYPFTIDLAAGFARDEWSETSLVGVENALGCGEGDTIRGDANANILKGFGGDDTIEGGAGDDTLDGGSGADSGDGGEGTDACIEVETPTSCEA